MLIETLFGNNTAEKVLLYLENYNEGYARGIATTYGIPLNLAQRQLRRFEAGGVLVSHLKGRTRLYVWNPRYSFLKELRALLSAALEMVPDQQKKLYYRQRRRPRRAGKML